jgi:tetratricopeptide (TPR) repeat protein
LHAAGRHREAAAQFRACAPRLALDPAPYLNLSASLLALGGTRGALDAARRAWRRAPKLAEAAYMVGMAYLACDRLDDAAHAFAAALRAAPRMADAWVNMGLIRYRRDDSEGAKAAMRRALAIVPNHIGAAANLGALLRLTGQVEASEQLLDDVLARDPDAAEARVNQGRPRCWPKNAPARPWHCLTQSRRRPNRGWPGILDFLDLPYDAACERFYEQDTRVRTVSRAQVKQPVNSRGLGRWRPYEAQLQPLIAALEEGGALPRDAD